MIDLTMVSLVAYIILVIALLMFASIIICYGLEIIVTKIIRCIKQQTCHPVDDEEIN